VTSPLPVLPQLIVEAGLQPDTPAQGGTTIFLNVGPGLGTGTLGTAVAWTDISQWVLGFTITRPATRLQGPLWNYQAGTVSILLDNSDGRFDMDNAGSPYAGFLVPMVPVRVRSLFGSIPYGLYSGFADGWLPATVTYEGGYAELTLPGTDAFKVLAGITLPALGVPEGVAADTGARVRDILIRAGWYTSADRNVISTGNSLLQGTLLGDTALNLMQIAVDSEIGQLYVNGAGAVVFRARRDMLTDTRSNTVQAVFGDLPALVQQSYDTAVTADTPTAWWKLADAPGSAAAADSAGAHAGTPANVTFGTRGPAIMAPAETAATFDGATSKIDTTYNPSGGATVTVEAWVNLAGRAQSGNPRIVANSHTDVDHDGFQLMLTGGTTPQAHFGNGTTARAVTAPAAVPASGWTYLAATWDGATVSLYVNGAPAGTGTLTGTLAAGTASTGIGYNPAYSGDFLTGTIAQVTVDTGAVLTPGRVAAHYQAAQSELAYAAIGRASDDTTIGNDIQATRTNGGVLQEVQDATSIAQYLFPRTYARSDLILQNDSDALNWAGWVLYIAKGGEDRIETLAVDPAADPYNLWPQVLGREIGDRIQIWTRPAGLASPVTKDCFIVGITHMFDPRATDASPMWLTTWTLADASKFGSFFTLDNPTLGRLGSNALTF
jgi:hypothetical protein